MLNILDWGIGWVFFALPILVVIYKRFSGLVAIILKNSRLIDKGLRVFIHRIIIVIFNICLVLLLGIDLKQLFLSDNLVKGLIWLIPGFILGAIVWYLTYQVIKNGLGGKEYVKVFLSSPRYYFLNLFLLVGPAEDIFFLGIFTYVLINRLGWWGIPIYVLFFSFYHYGNVLKGAESNREFLMMLPSRLLIGIILSVAFYRTNSLIIPILIHNLYDTGNFVAAMMGHRAKNKVQQARI